MTKDEFCDLFALSLRGALAQAFLHRGISPTADEWAMLSGNRDMTERDIGAMVFRLDCEAALTISLRDRAPVTTEYGE